MSDKDMVEWFADLTDLQVHGDPPRGIAAQIWAPDLVQTMRRVCQRLILMESFHPECAHHADPAFYRFYCKVHATVSQFKGRLTTPDVRHELHEALLPIVNEIVFGEE